MCLRVKKRFFLHPSSPWSSVADPWHFGVDSDPDPRIHASDWWIRMRIRILIFSLLAFKMPTKKWLMDPNPDPGGQKTCGSGGSGFGSATLPWRKESESELDPDPVVRGAGPRIQIRTKKSQIPNTRRGGKRFILEDFSKETRNKGYLSGPGVHDVNQTMNSLPRK